MSDLMKEIGRQIKHYRKAKGMTQKELGEKVGCHEVTIRQYENGLREPRMVSKLAIARALDVSYNRLFSLKDGTNLAEVGTDCISRQAAISAICNACGKIDCDKMDKCEKLQLPPTNCSEFPNNSDTISRQAAIDGLRDYLVGKRCPDDGTLTCRLIENEVINKLIPIQPKRGRWLYCEDTTADCVDGYRCDQCGFFVPWDYQHKGIDFIQDYNFCPHCGSYNGGKNEI